MVAAARGVDAGRTTKFAPGNHSYILVESTFMKILIGAEDTDSGVISRPKRTSWLRQDHYAFDHLRVLDVVIMGNKRLWEAIQGKEEIYARGEFTDADNEALGDLECVVAQNELAHRPRRQPPPGRPGPCVRLCQARQLVCPAVLTG